MSSTMPVPSVPEPRYVLYLSTSRGVFRSTDEARSWHRWGPESLIIERLLGTPNGVVFAIGTQARGNERASGLFSLQSGQAAWHETRFTDRWDSQWGFRLRAACLALLFPHRNHVLVGTGAGLWLHTPGGAEDRPLGPWTDDDRRRPAAVLDVVISRSHYGEVDPVPHPLMLAACDSGMYWTRWGESWFSPYPPPNDSLTRLSEYGASIAAWTKQGVYLNHDARSGGWEHLDPAKADRMRELVYSDTEASDRSVRAADVPGKFIAVRVAPDNQKLWCSNGPQLWVAQADYGSSRYPHSWQRVWEDSPDAGYPPGRGRRPLVMPPVFSPDYEQDGAAFAVASCGGVIKSTDGGMTWTQANDGLDGPLGRELIAVAFAQSSHEANP